MQCPLAALDVNTLVAVGAGLLMVGGVMVVSGACACRTAAARAGVLTPGSLLLVSGLAVLVYAACGTRCKKSTPPTVVRGSHVPEQPHPGLSELAVSDAGVRPPTRPGVHWEDELPVSPGSPLETVAEFVSSEPPVAVAESPRVRQPAHQPLDVPALPRNPDLWTEKQKRRHHRRHPPSPRLGYQPASISSAPCGPVGAASEAGTFQAAVGSLYYEYKYPYPTVNEVLEERQRFESRPETPEITRHRRIGELQEATVSLSPPGRDGLVVPVAIAPRDAPPNQDFVGI